MKHFKLFLIAIFTFSLLVGCGGKSTKVVLPPGISSDIAVLSLGADTSSLNQDQIVLLNHSLNWMDRDIMRALKRKGFQPVRINNEHDFNGEGNGYLLKVSITDHKMIPKGVRLLAGMMAGTDRLKAHFDLIDSNFQTILSWDDVQGSTRGGTYCAQTINRNAAKKIADYLTHSY
ncbi:MAG: hypothetical protein OEM02_05710 [Desulfobulbaceae bacterium]|nr:hypothetical protein [Desulfobulbaceae bacterium]